MNNKIKEPSVWFVNRVRRDFGKEWFEKEPTCNKRSVEKVTNHVEELYDLIDQKEDDWQRACNDNAEKHNENQALKDKIKTLEAKIETLTQSNELTEK